MVNCGVIIFTTDKSMQPVELAKAVEERGLDSLFVPEHTHIPTSRRTPPPAGTDILPEEYLRSPDPYIALAAAASVSRRFGISRFAPTTSCGMP